MTSYQSSNGDTVSYVYNAQGRISQMTDALGRTRTFTYDASGDYLMGITTIQGNYTLSYVTTPGANAHALASITYPDGTHLYNTYDSQGRLTLQTRDGGAQPLSYAYDNVGGFTLTRGNDSTIGFLRNAEGRITRMTNSAGSIIGISYDPSRNLVGVTGPQGIQYSFTYNTQGRLTSLSDARGDVFQMNYEPQFNNLSRYLDPRGNLRQCEWNGLSEPTKVTYPDGSTQVCQYDAAGNLTSYTDRAGNNLALIHNANGLVTQKTYTGGSTEQFTYNPHRKLSSMTDSRGQTTFQYDSADRMTKVTYPSGRFLQFTYNAGGLRTQMADQSGATVNYAYDAVGRLWRLTDNNSKLIVQYGYDPVGRLAREDKGDGAATVYSYDPQANLSSLVNYGPSSNVLSQFVYTYDLAGRATQVDTTYGRWTLAYDLDGQLVHAVLSSSDPSIASQDLAYAYDAMGNRVSVTANGTTNAYAANNLDQYLSAGDATFAYDANGNLVTRAEGTNTWNYTYDANNRLQQATGPGGTWSYEYDAVGNRISSTHNGQKTEFLVDPTGFGDVEAEYRRVGEPGRTLCPRLVPREPRERGWPGRLLCG